MARGKYAAKAERRRTVEENQQIADEATHTRDKAMRDLEEYRAKAGAKIARLEEQLARAVADRDDATSPLVRELTERAEDYRRQLAEAKDAQKLDLERWRVIMDGFLKGYLMKVHGLTLAEAWEVMLNCVPGKARTTHIMTSARQGDSVEKELALGAARGTRHPRDLLTEIFDSLNEEAVPRESGELMGKPR